MSLAKITGGTRLYAIVGDPVAQVRSPEVFCDQFAAKGIDAVLVPAHVPAQRFDEIVAGLLGLGNLHGLLVTAPFKSRIVNFADRLGATAEGIGALNALRREADGTWTGDMFDGTGFLRAVERKGENVHGRSILLFGAGGAGSAIAFALAGAGVLSIDIVDIDIGRSRALAQKLSNYFPECASTSVEGLYPESDFVINASPVGMRDEDGLPGQVGPLRPGTVVGDVVISSTPTSLIRYATQCGRKWVDGRDMHAGQVEAIMTFFTSTLLSLEASADTSMSSGSPYGTKVQSNGTHTR